MDIASNNSEDNFTVIPTQDVLSLNTDVVSAVLATVMVFTIFGNALVLFSFYAQPSLRDVKYFPITNLALADLLCAVTAMPLYITKKNASSENVDARLVCDLYRFSYFFTEYASIMSLMVISIERFLNIKYPLKSRNYICGRVMITVLVTCWFEALFVASMPFYWRDVTDTECRNSPTSTWSLMAITLNVFIPFLIMLSSNCYIYYKTLSEFGRSDSEQKVKASQQGFRPRKTRIRAEKWKVERKATISFSVVIGVFVICWGPSTVYYFLENISPHWFDGSFKRYKGVFGATMKILTFCNSFMNPILYFWLNVDFRKAFIRILKREWTGRSRSGTMSSMSMMMGSTRACNVQV